MAKKSAAPATASAGSKFHIFRGLKAGEKLLEDPLEHLPLPPPWRQFGKELADFALVPPEKDTHEPSLRETDLAEAYQIDQDANILDAVNAALYLRRPLLVTGPAGCGKTSLIHAVARELRLGPVLSWNITSRSTLREGLYDYDALGRLQEIQMRPQGAGDAATSVARFLRLGPLGTALLPAKWPKALLIDEIDKADLDLPNDLLYIFEDAKFTIEELRREASDGKPKEERAPWKIRTWKDLYGEQDIPAAGEVACTVFPFILLTSNNEREFSAPFLRRCVQLKLALPTDSEKLARIVKAHLKESGANAAAEAKTFLESIGGGKKLATDQLMNAVYMLERCKLSTEEKARLRAVLYSDLKG